MKSSGTSDSGASGSRLGRNVVICCDGTGVSEEHTTGQAKTPSNVLKIFHCVDTDSPVGAAADGSDTHSDEDAGEGEETEPPREQIAFYERGVASAGNLLSKAGAGMTGYGIDSKVMIMYHFLGKNWRSDKDRLYLFGFSRGAFAVRSLMGMIYRVGLLDLRGLDFNVTLMRVKTAYIKGYRMGIPKKEWAKGEKKILLRQSKGTQEPWPFHGDEHGRVPIHFVGAFDTVGQLGLPRETWCLYTCGGMLCRIKSKDNEYHDVSLNPTVKTARHAVAIDEQRSTFQPVFDRQRAPNLIKDHGAKCRDFKQVWFPGCHGNIGGGLADCGLSDISLKWMLDEASRTGLRLRESLTDQIRPNYQGSIYYSHSVSIYKNLTHYPRSVPAIISANSESGNPEGMEVIHETAIQRSQNPPLHDAMYFPTKYLEVGHQCALIIRADRVYNNTAVYLEHGATYLIKAQGEWSGYRGRICGPEGYSTSMFHRPLAVNVAVGIGRLERAWRHVSGNKETNLPFTRRHDHSPWYAVMAMIATGGTRDVVTKADFHTIFEIGKEVTYEVKGRGGYLYCYANDTWGTYLKNKGAMELSIERLA